MNKVGDAAGVLFANQASLQYLNLGYNLLTDITAYAFAARSTKLNFLIIYGNSFTEKAINAIKSNSNIEYLANDYVIVEQLSSQFFKRNHLATVHKHSHLKLSK